MAFCSAVTLCFASIFSLVSAALLAIAFSTDNWQVISVRRAELRVRKKQICMISTFELELVMLLHCVPLSTVFFQKRAICSKIIRFSKFVHRVITNALNFVSKT